MKAMFQMLSTRQMKILQLNSFVESFVNVRGARFSATCVNTYLYAIMVLHCFRLGDGNQRNVCWVSTCVEKMTRYNGSVNQKFSFSD